MPIDLSLEDAAEIATIKAPPPPAVDDDDCSDEAPAKRQRTDAATVPQYYATTQDDDAVNKVRFKAFLSCIVSPIQGNGHNATLQGPRRKKNRLHKQLYATNTTDAADVNERTAKTQEKKRCIYSCVAFVACVALDGNMGLHVCTSHYYHQP